MIHTTTEGYPYPEKGITVPTVAVIVTTYNDPQFLREAVESVLAQTRPADEVLVVDDGSERSPETILSAFPQVSLLRKHNGGVSNARNYGLGRAKSDYVAFLDADDRLDPQALENGLRCFAAHPKAVMVYGAHRRIGPAGAVLSAHPVRPVGDDPYADLLRGNYIGMHATVLYRRQALIDAGGFDESLRYCEDYEVYLRLARQHPVVAYPEVAAEYRWHGANTSTDTAAMLEAALGVLDRHRDQPPTRRRAWHEGEALWRAWYTNGQYWEWDTPAMQASLAWRTRKMVRMFARRVKEKLRNGRAHRLLGRLFPVWPPPVGAVRFGALETTTPISMDFGWDRGTPIDRFYIERFLEQHRADIAGRVLEVADDAYSRRFGGPRVTQQDVLHMYQAGPGVTIVGDLTVPGVLPENAFDCIVLTETLQFIFELREAVTRLHATLKPGGVLLLTAPGIRQLERSEWADKWCWSFTKTSIERLFAEHFEPEEMQVEAHGNVYAAVAGLHGAAVEEVNRRKLEVDDPAYPCFLSLRAQRRR